MFNKNDPLISAVSNVMKENEVRRQVEKKLCEELGIYSRKALPREHQANYDALLEQRINEAMTMKKEATDPSKYSVKQKKLARVGTESGHGGDPNRIDAPDLAAARKGHASHIEEAEQLNEIGDTAKGRKAINTVAHRADDEIANQAMKSRPNKKKLNKALRAVNLAVNADERRGGKVLNSYIKRSYGLDEVKMSGPETGPRKTAGSNQPIAEEEKIDEASYSAKAARAGKDIGKPGKEFAKIAASAAERYGSEERGKKVAGAVLKKIRAKNISEEEGEETREGGAVQYNGKPVVSPTATRAGDSSASRPAPEGPSQRERSALTNMIKNIKEEEVQIDEKKLTDAEMSKREELAKKMKKGDWSKRYGERGKSVMYATATKMAKKLAEDATIDSVMEEIRKNLGEDAFNALMSEQTPAADPRRNPATGRIRTLQAAQRSEPQTQSWSDSPSERTGQVARTATPPGSTTQGQASTTAPAAPRPNLPSMAVSGPKLSPSDFKGNTPSVSVKDALGSTSDARSSSYASTSPLSTRATGFSTDKPSTPAAPAAPATRPAASASSAPRPAATPAAAPEPASKQMFQAAQDRANRGENDTAAFFAADRQMQRERGNIQESVESTIRKIIQK